MSKKCFPVCRACGLTKLKVGDLLTITPKESKCAICGKESKEGFTLFAEAEEQKFGMGKKEYKESKEVMGETYWKFVKVIDWLDGWTKKA